MDCRFRLVTLLAALHLALGTPAPGQTGYGEIETPETIGAAEGDRDEDGFGLHLQVGAFHRLAANILTEKTQSYLFTADLSGLRWSRTESTWGLGVHFAYDDDGHRLGVKGLWRTPLKRGTWSYLQVSPGIYVSATDNSLTSRFPGFFLEAELGLAREFALVVVGEARPYEDLTVYHGDPYNWIAYNETKQSGTATALYVGGKVGQMGAVAVAVAGLIAAIVVGVSLASSGGVM